MNHSVFLHIVERLEGLLGKLPASMQKPILSELTPLKELFLQQRPPRFVLTGSHPIPLLDFVARIFSEGAGEPSRETLTGLFRWQKVLLGNQGALELLDARGADEAALALIREELKARPADLFFFLPAERDAKVATRREIERLETLLPWNGNRAKLFELRAPTGVTDEASALEQAALASAPAIRASLAGNYSLGGNLRQVLARELPNEARVEMVRIGGDRAARLEIAELLVKSTSAIATAIGAQPIPLADLPILTTLQLVMVSGIMYISGRERSMRAATEFVGALGANVGLGMILRQGTRAALKFLPGFGNLISGMVAGAGTYAIGRAANVYFIEGASLSDARRTFLRSKKKPLPLLPPKPMKSLKK
jgi:uncharacterized protein (DUF697 family)